MNIFVFDSLSFQSGLSIYYIYIIIIICFYTTRDMCHITWSFLYLGLCLGFFLASCIMFSAFISECTWGKVRTELPSYLWRGAIVSQQPEPWFPPDRLIYILDYRMCYYAFLFLQQIMTSLLCPVCWCRILFFCFVFLDRFDMTLYVNRFIFDNLIQFYFIVTRNVKESPFCLFMVL